MKRFIETAIALLVLPLVWVCAKWGPYARQNIEGERLRGQAEGFAAAVQQLRGMGGMKPRPPLWSAAAELADSLERSRIPMQADPLAKDEERHG